MSLKLCQQCKRPFLASQKVCPRCPHLEWEQEFVTNIGCLLATILPLLFFIIFWLLFIFGVFYDILIYFE